MLETMADRPGDHLTLEAYSEDFNTRFWSVCDAPIYKLERQQDFRQPENASWVASVEGRWEEALRLLKEDRPNLEQLFAHIAARGNQVRRARMVQWPLTPYLYWELHSLHLRAQCGEDVRVIGPEPIAPLESEHTVPEIVTLGDTVAYRILYDAQGILEGAVRYTDPRVVTGCRDDIASLHHKGEDLESFFTHIVAPLDASRTP